MIRSSFARRATIALAGALLLCVVAPVAAGAAGKGPVIWAHRGGSYAGGVARYPENTLPAFNASAKLGFALEFDVVLTKDRVPLVIHDETLDRTTPCTGNVRDRTYADIAANCRTDVLGSPGGPLGKRSKTTKPSVSLPTLAQVLAVARKHHVLAAPELKENDQTGESARVLAAGIRASKIGTRNVVVQSFIPPMLANIEKELPGVPTSQLTITPPVAALQFAIDGRDTYVSPQFVAAIDAAYVRLAHAARLKVAPYTLDSAAEVRRAKTLKVDALITDDPSMARATLGQKTPRR